MSCEDRFGRFAERGRGKSDSRAMLHLWYRPLAYRRVPSKMRPPQDRLRSEQTVFQPRASASDSEGKGGGDRDKNLSSGGGQLV